MTFTILFLLTFLLMPTIVLIDFLWSLRRKTEYAKAAHLFLNLQRAAALKNGVIGVDEACIALRFDSVEFTIPILKGSKRIFDISKMIMTSEHDRMLKALYGESFYDNKIVAGRLSKSLNLIYKGCLLHSPKLLYEGNADLLLTALYGKLSDRIIVPSLANTHDIELLSDLRECSAHIHELDLPMAFDIISRWYRLEKLHKLSPPFLMVLTIFRTYINVVYYPARAPLDGKVLVSKGRYLSKMIIRSVRYLERRKHSRLIPHIVRFLSSFDEIV